MPDKFKIIDPQDEILREQLDKIEWPIYYGNIRVQIRQGKPTLIVVEKTIKNDKKRMVKLD